ncbi:glycoside hydrolase family protein [Larkinella bovis]|uniref:Lysozyme n=1 Tax=Larkinella bovis TaxID=683041 RepID=A0ABW0IFI0_9BACT
MDKTVIANWIRSHEVVESQAYTDLDGHSTVGIGFDLDEAGARERLEGVGTNFESVLDGKESLTETQIEELFNQDIDHSIVTARSIFPDLDAYPANKQVAIIDMVFDLGERDFKKLDTVIDAIKQQHWTDASTKMQKSVLFNQLSHRATEEISLMRDEYNESSCSRSGSYNEYTDTYYSPGVVPYHVDSPLNSLETAITTIHLMHLMDMQHEHPESQTTDHHAPTIPSPDALVDHTETPPVGIIPEYNISPYIDYSLHLTANDIYLVTDQPGDPGYPSPSDYTPTDLTPGAYVDYTEAYPADGNPLETTTQNTDLPPLPVADDIYLNNDCLNVQSGWRTAADWHEFMTRNGFETSPPFNDSPGLEVYTDQALPHSSHLDGGHDFTSID